MILRLALRRRDSVAVFVNRTGESLLEPLGRMAADWVTRGLTHTDLVDVGAIYVQRPITEPGVPAVLDRATREIRLSSSAWQPESAGEPVTPEDPGRHQRHTLGEWQPQPQHDAIEPGVARKRVRQSVER
jgi:hypothetical protein